MPFVSSVRRALLVLTLFTAPALAADATSAHYDVRDLLVATPDYAVPAGKSAPATRPAASTGASLVDAVRATLPDTATVRLDEKAGRLTVTGDARRQTAEVLRTLRAARFPMVQVQARVIDVPAAILAVAPEPVRAAVAVAAFDSGRRVAELSDADAGTLLALVAGHAAVSQLTAPRLTLFNGQQAYLRVTTDTNYVSDLTRIQGKDGAFGHDPTVEAFTSGLTMSVRAAAAGDASAVAMNASIKLVELLALNVVDGPDGGKVQRPQSRTTGYDGLIVVPRGKTALLLLATAEAAGPAAATGQAILTSRPAAPARRMVLISATATTPQMP